MSQQHHRRPDRAVVLASVAVGVMAMVAVLVPVLLVREDDRPLITAPPVASTPPVGTSAPAPEPAPAGSVLPSRPGVPARPPPSLTALSPPPPPPGTRATAWSSGLCLATGATRPEDGTPVVQQPCRSTLARRFRLEPGPNGTVALVDRRSGRCLDISGGSTDDGANVILWTCHGRANQLFTRRPVPGSGGRSQLVAVHSGKCVDVVGAATTAGAAVQQWSCHSAGDETRMRNQSWLLGG